MEDLRREANNNLNLSVNLPTVRDVSMYIKIKDSVDGTRPFIRLSINNNRTIVVLFVAVRGGRVFYEIRRQFENCCRAYIVVFAFSWLPPNFR